MMLLLAGIFASSSTVISSKQFVRAIAGMAPGALTEDGFSQFWRQWWWLFVKGWHATEFLLVYFAVTYAIGPNRKLLVFALCALFAASDEIHQIWVPKRGAHLSDCLIDLLGIATLLTTSHLRGWKSNWPPRIIILVQILIVAIALGVLRYLALNPIW